MTPPLPRRTLFPPLKLLRGLEDEEQTPAATPWWLLLLRLLAAALLIVALADPLLGRSPKLAGAGPLVIIVDNGWTAAKNWEAAPGPDRRPAAQRAGAARRHHSHRGQCAHGTFE